MKPEWPEHIDLPYRRWLANLKPSHPIDYRHFTEFRWECFLHPEDAPSEVEFRERLARDLNYPPDADGYPHAVVSRYQSLYVDFFDVAEFILKQRTWDCTY